MDVVINNVSHSSGTTTDFVTSLLITLKNNVSQNSNNFKHFRQYFSWYDYILFSVMLAASAAIGLFYGCYGNKTKSTEEYLMGRKRMGLWPLTISLIAGFVYVYTLYFLYSLFTSISLFPGTLQGWL